MNIQHSSRSDDWMTPSYIVDMIWKVLGVVDLDPASSEQANEIVQARQYLDVEANGLTSEWFPPVVGPWPTVYLNPPGGKLGNKSMVRLFWQKLMAERHNIGHAIFAMFSIEGLQTTQGDHPCALDFPVCIPAKRVRWVHPTEKKYSPSHSNAFIYVPGHIDYTDRFIEVFSELGKCKL